jgi:hypothetical protein
MQYRLVVRRLCHLALRLGAPRVHRPRIDQLFARPAQFRSHVEDSVLDRLLLPAARRTLGVTAALRALPQGQLQRYILYIVAVLVPLLVWALVGGP